MMTTKTQSSTLTLKTLKGAFEEPKMNHRRDFLRENKLSLRELQKTTTHKLIQQRQENERKQNRHLQRYQKTQEQTFARRSASQCRNVEQNCNRQSRLEAGRDEGGGGTVPVPNIRGKPNYLGLRRAYSQQRQSVENLQKISSCCCSHRPAAKTCTRETQYRERMPRSASAVSVVSKAESCDKEIQTEDIHDEDFLYEALKKCSSSDVHQLYNQKSHDQFNAPYNNLQHDHSNDNLQQYETEINTIQSRNRMPYTNNNYYPKENLSRHDHGQQYHTTRSQDTLMLNGHKEQHENVQVNGDIDKDLEEHIRNLNINNHIRMDTETQNSARSRQTMCSTSTRRSVHKLGCREDVRLPRYLEKEKREKEEERVRELAKDPNCPLGHYALSEEERLTALHKAQKKMDSLINELNHMPMTTETLRIRNRKVEIEKELSQIELDIRFYSKPKVYIAETPMHY